MSPPLERNPDKELINWNFQDADAFALLGSCLGAAYRLLVAGGLRLSNEQPGNYPMTNS
jgi:hypothetical protein